MVSYRELTPKETRNIYLLILGILVGYCIASALIFVFLRHHMAIGGTAFGGLTLILLVVAFRWHARSFAYRCPECKHEFMLTVLQDFISPNHGKHKRVTCPSCHKMVLATGLKVVYDDT